MSLNDTPKKKAKQTIFLEEFAKHGNLTQAARAAEVERKTVYRWKESSDIFLLRYNQAFEEAKDALREEVHRRGVEGWDEDVYQGGKRVGVIHKYSDVLLIFRTKALCPEYRERQQIDIGHAPGQVEIYKIRLPSNGRDEGK